MDITLKQVCPEFLQDTGSEVWGCDLHFSEKTWVNVAAPSGSGKTSFVSILYGLFQAYTGTLQFDGKEAASLSRSEWAGLRQHKLALMFQDLRLFNQLTCLDNVVLKAGQTGEPDRGAIGQAFDRLGIGALLTVSAGQCSQGEKQRVAFVRAIMQPFDWIFLDEPFSHLDDVCIAAMRDLLVEACDRNQAGLIVTSLTPDQWLTYHRAVAL
jgi:putative ABC transport system ATP-binding protein